MAYKKSNPNGQATMANSEPVVVSSDQTSIPTYQVSGASFSTNVVGFTASVATVLYSPEGTYAQIDSDNRLSVKIDNEETGAVLGRVYAVDPTNSNRWDIDAGGYGYVTARQASGYADSTNIVGPIAQGDAATALRVVIAGNSDASMVVNSGTITTVTTVGSITNSLAAAMVDSGGVQYSGSNPFPVDIINIGDVAISTGNGVVGTGVQRMVIASNTTTAVVGTVASDVADDGAPPVKNGGIARTANPTAVAAGDAVTYGADDLGRQVIRINQVRDLIQTAYVSVTNGTETTLRAAVAGAYLDLIMLVASNNSDAAVSVDIRPVTAGNIVNTLRIPANGTAGWTPAVPWPQTDTGNNWTVDGPDETGRTLTFSALFSQEI